MKTIGIIGHGFVGKAVDHGFNKNIEKLIVDTKYGGLTTTELVSAHDLEAIFVCVPTPMSDTGAVDPSIVESVLRDIQTSTPKDQKTLVILKSTITPDFLKQFISDFDRISLVYNPEFLTEKNYLEDFIKPDLQILGGTAKDTQAVQRLYQEHSQCCPCPYYHTDAVTASFVKYTINTFLAQKVSYFNQMFDLWQIVNPDGSWEQYTTIVGTDPRLGTSHMQVPGHDGKRGFGGSCFPKDTQALVAFAEAQGVPFRMLEQTLKVNDELRD